MKFTKQDLYQVENLIKALNKGSFTLEGVEVIAMAEVFKWVGKLSSSIKLEIEQETNKPTVEINEVKEVVTEPQIVSKNKKRVTK